MLLEAMPSLLSALPSARVRLAESRILLTPEFLSEGGEKRETCEGDSERVRAQVPALILQLQGADSCSMQARAALGGNAVAPLRPSFSARPSCRVSHPPQQGG